MNTDSGKSLGLTSLHPARGEAIAVAATVAVSVLIGSAFAMGWRSVLAAVAGGALFVALTWDLRLVLPLLVFLFPLGPRFAMGFGNLYLSTAVLIIVYAAWFWRSSFLARPWSFRTNPVVIAIAIFLGVLVVSALQNLSFLISNRTALLRFVQLFLYAGFFGVVLSMTLSRRAIKVYMVLVIAAGIVEMAVALVRWHPSSAIFVNGTFEGGHSDFAVYAIMIAMLLAGVLLHARTRGLALAAGAGLVLTLVAIVFSFSRGGYASLGVGLVCTLAMPAPRRRRIAFAAVLGIAGSILLLFGPALVFRSLKDVMTTLTVKTFSISFVRRLGMWKEALLDLAKNPILGRGTWSYVLRDNFYMKVLGEAGIAGLVAFIGLLATLIRQEWRAIKACPDDGFMRGMVTGLLPATVACLVIFEMSGDYFLNHRFMGGFWMVLALALKFSFGIGIEDSKADGRTA